MTVLVIKNDVLSIRVGFNNSPVNNADLQVPTNRLSHCRGKETICSWLKGNLQAYLSEKEVPKSEDAAEVISDWLDSVFKLTKATTKGRLFMRRFVDSLLSEV